MSFKNTIGNNTEMNDDRVNHIISELIDKTKLLAEELRNSNRIATELMATNAQLKQEYSILKNKFLEFLTEDDLQDYIQHKNNPKSNNYTNNNLKINQLNEELMNLKSNKRELDIECVNLKQELNQCKSRLAQQDKQARSYTLMQDIAANKDEEINNLQLQLQLLTTQVQQDIDKKQSNNKNTQLTSEAVVSLQDNSQPYYSFQKQENHLQQVSYEHHTNDKQQSKQILIPEQSQHVSPNTSYNKDMLDKSNGVKNKNILDGSNQKVNASEVDIIYQDINKPSQQTNQQGKSPRAFSISNNNEISYDKTKKAVHQQSHGMIPTSNTTLPPSTTHRSNISHLDHPNSNVNVPALQNNNNLNTNNNLQTNNINGKAQNINNNKKQRGLSDRSESQPAIFSKTPKSATITPYYQRNFVGQDFNDLLYSEQPYREDFSQDDFDKNSNSHSSFNAQLNFFNVHQQNAKNQTGIQQLNYPPGNNFHNTVLGKQQPQSQKESQILLEMNENSNNVINPNSFDKMNMNKNYENRSQISPLNKNIGEYENSKQQQFIDPYQSKSTKQLKSNNIISLGFDQHHPQKGTQYNLIKKQQGGTRNSSVQSNKWK